MINFINLLYLSNNVLGVNGHIIVSHFLTLFLLLNCLANYVSANIMLNNSPIVLWDTTLFSIYGSKTGRGRGAVMMLGMRSKMARMREASNFGERS